MSNKSDVKTEKKKCEIKTVTERPEKREPRREPEKSYIRRTRNGEKTQPINRDGNRKFSSLV